jgi:hypothetical protein
MTNDDKDDLQYDDAGRCIASPYRWGLRALGTNPRALGINVRRRKRRALRNWKRKNRRVAK